MRNRGPWIFFVVGLALVALLTVLLSGNSTPVTDADPGVRAASASGPSAPEQSAPEKSAPQGLVTVAASAAGQPWDPSTMWRGTYALEVRANVAQSASLGVGGDVTLSATVTLGAPLVGTPIDGSGGGDHWVGGRVAEVKVAGAPGLVEHFRMPDSASSAFAVRIDSDGPNDWKVVDERFEPEIPAGVRNTLSTIVAALTPDAPDPEADQGTSTWLRGQAEESVKGRGHAELVRDRSGLLSVEYRYELSADLTLDDSAPTTQTITTQVRMTRTGTSVGTAATGIGGSTLLTDEQITRNLTPPIHPDEPLLPVPEDAAGAVAQLLAEADVAFKARDQKTRPRVERQLGTLLDQSQAARDALVQTLRDESLQGNRLRTATNAIMLTRGPVGRALRVALISDVTLPVAARHSIVTAMTFASEPATDALAALTAIVDGEVDPLMRSTAAFALAGIAHFHVEKNPALALALRTAIVERATASFAVPDQEEHTMWVSALGNLGGADLWPLLAPFVTSQDEQLRYRAIESLRFVKTVPSRMAIAKAMALDPSFANRRRAVETALYQPQAAMQGSVIKALREDVDASVRLAAAHVVAVWSVTTPALVAEVEAAAEREPHAATRSAMLQLKPESLDASTELPVEGTSGAEATP